MGVFWKKQIREEEGSRRELAEAGSENEKLRRVQQQLEELEAFISWLNSLCDGGQKQICGIRKIAYGGSDDTCYIGFVLSCQNHAGPRLIYTYDIKGYVSRNMNPRDPAYSAQVEQHMTEIQMTMTSSLYIVDNQVLDPNAKHKGVGTAGIFVMKEIAKRLRCEKITGRRMAQPDTPEERAKLIAFYTKNGFSQNEENENILFDMRDYTPHTKAPADGQSPLEVPDALEDICARVFDQGIDAGIQTVVIRMLKSGRFESPDIAEASGLLPEEVSSLRGRLDAYYPITFRPDPQAHRPTWSVALPRDMLPEGAKAHLADPELQERIIAVVRDYMTEQKER